MGAKVIGILFRKQEKIVRCFLAAAWFVLASIVAATLYRAGMETNNNGQFCDYNIWERGLIYQWIWERDKPCIFSLEYYIRLSFFMIPLYLLYDYVRRRIVGFNPNILWRMAEVGIWFALNWGYLLWLTATDYGTLNWTMGYTSFAGTLLFFVPIILLAGGTYLLSNRAVIWTFFGMLLIYVGLVFLAMTREIM